MQTLSWNLATESANCSQHAKYYIHQKDNVPPPHTHTYPPTTHSHIDAGIGCQAPSYSFWELSPSRMNWCSRVPQASPGAQSSKHTTAQRALSRWWHWAKNNNSSKLSLPPPAVANQNLCERMAQGSLRQREWR